MLKYYNIIDFVFSNPQKYGNIRVSKRKKIDIFQYSSRLELILDDTILMNDYFKWK